MVFDCPFKMKPSANSIYDLKDATAPFFILVKNTDGGFLIGSFATGIRSLPRKPFDLLKKFLYWRKKVPHRLMRDFLLVQFFGF